MLSPAPPRGMPPEHGVTAPAPSSLPATSRIQDAEMPAAGIEHRTPRHVTTPHEPALRAGGDDHVVYERLSPHGFTMLFEAPTPTVRDCAVGSGLIPMLKA